MYFEISSKLLIVAGLVSVYGWDKDGHDAVGGTSMSMIDSSASSKLKSILGGEDASDVAGWAHRVEDRLGWTRPVHFIAQSDWQCARPDPSVPGICDNGHCLETGIRHFFRQLTRGENIPGTNVMQDDTGLTDSDAMRMIINLVGDSSQPFHVGFASDNFGKNAFVRLPQGLAVGSGEVVSLYELWDVKLSQHLITNPYNPNFWWSGWTHVKNMHPVTLDNEKKNWEKSGVDSVTEWIQDSAQFLCNKIYTDPATGAKIDFSRDMSNPTDISLATYRIWEQLLRERILLGGARLGILLNAILTNPDAVTGPKLRRGSAVSGLDKVVTGGISEIFDDGEDSKDTSRAAQLKKTSASGGVNAGLLNVGILIGIVFALFLVVRFTGRDSSHGIHAAKAQVVEMVGSQAKRVLNSHKD